MRSFVFVLRVAVVGVDCAERAAGEQGGEGHAGGTQQVVGKA